MNQMLESSSKFLESLGPYHPKIGVVLGSGLGYFIESFDEKIEVPYSQIPYFKNTSIKGHQGRLVLGKINGVEVLALMGRLHAYEGHSQAEVVYPIRTLATFGVEKLILTNASGGINKSFFPGDIVSIEDHLNLTGTNPLVGLETPSLAPRFTEMTYAYDPTLKSILQDSARELNLTVKTGIYAGVLGPSYETPAEVRMLRALGADMVGMSTVSETIAANHMGLKVSGISLISNHAAKVGGEEIDHDEVTSMAIRTKGTFSSLLENFIIKIGMGHERGH